MNKHDELVDLVDENGKIQIIGVPRSEIGKYPNFHLQIIIVYIFDKNGKVLVQKRSSHKKVDPNAIDAICGCIKTKENPKSAAIRESIEESNIKPTNLKLVTKGINKYNCFRYLFIGKSNSTPKIVNRLDVEWVNFIDPKELKLKKLSRELIFVNEFIEDMELAIQKMLTYK